MIRFVAFCLVALIQLPAVAGTYNQVVSIGDEMPDFTHLPSTWGATVSASDYSDYDVLVLVSLANHCPWSNGADGDTSELARRFADQNVAFLGFSVSHREEDKLPAMIEHAEQADYPFNFLYDESQELGRALGATATPEYFVYNSDRELVYTGLLHNSPATNRGGSLRYTEGEPTDHYVRDAIQATLEGEEVAVKETQSFGCVVEYVQS